MPAVISPTPYWATVATQFTSGHLGTSTSRPNVGRDLLLAAYMDSNAGTITTTAAGASALIETETGSGDTMIVGFVDAADGAATNDWTTSTFSGVQIGISLDTQGLTPPAIEDLVLEVTPITRVANIRSQNWPAVTPTKVNQTVICLWGYSDNSLEPSTEAALDAASYADATYAGGGSIDTSSGADSAVGWHAFRIGPDAVGVPFSPATNNVPSAISGTLCTVLVDNAELAYPQLIAGAVTNSVQLDGDFTMPAQADVEALAEDGDVFFIYSLGWSGAASTFGSAAWLDGQWGGGSPSPPASCIGWKRLDRGAASVDAAWFSSPPQMSYSSTGQRYAGWGLIRGVQRSGTLFQSGYTAGGPSFINYWTDVPYIASAAEVIIAGVEVNADPNGVNWPTQPASQQIEQSAGARSGVCVIPAAEWTPGSPGTGVDFDWAFNRTPRLFQVNFLEAAPTWFADAAVTAPATVTATLTSQPGAQFVEAAITAPATVDAAVTSLRNRYRRPRRVTVWTAGIDGVRNGAIT